MRAFHLLTLAVGLGLPFAAAAETTARSTVTSVTLYPEGAEVTRVVRVDLAAGANAVLIGDLPAGLIAEALRILPSEGVILGAYVLQADRPVADAAAPSPERISVEAALLVARAEMTAATGAVDMVQADIAAADARVAFAQSVRLEQTGTTAELVRDTAAAVGAEVARARQAAVAARANLPPLELALARAAQALARAEAVLAALPIPATNHATLLVNLNAATAGKAELTIRHFVADAGWSPVHDWHLSTGDRPRLRLERAAFLHQSSGEDWKGVAVTLSTAQPGQQMSPSGVWPQLRQVIDPVSSYGSAGDAASVMMEPIMEADVVTKMAAPVFQGDIVTYVYPDPVNLAQGQANLRLPLNTKDLTPRPFAQGVPGQDQTAFAMAEFVNDTGEIILPGQSSFYRDGNFLGVQWQGQIAAGDKAELAFGAIDQIRLSEVMPTRQEGDRGFIATTTELSETRVMKVENLGAQVWDLRLLASVPYSEQEELVAQWSSDLPPTEMDVKGQRGILAWDFPVQPGQVRELTLTHSLTWPEGKILQ